MGVVRPARLDEDGRPVAVQHVLQLVEDQGTGISFEGEKLSNIILNLRPVSRLGLNVFFISFDTKGGLCALQANKEIFHQKIT